MARISFGQDAGSSSAASAPPSSGAAAVPGAGATTASAPGSHGTVSTSSVLGSGAAGGPPGAGSASVPGAASAQGSQHPEDQAPSLFKGSDGREAFGPDYGYKRIRFHKGDEVNPYADQQDARFGIDPRAKKLIALAVACVLLFILVCILPTNVFSLTTRTDHSIGAYAAEIAASFQGFIAFFANPNSMYGIHVFTVLVTLLAGAAMGLSGGVFQGSMKNALASPSTLGVTNGGTIGVIIYAVFIAPMTVGAVFTGSLSDYGAQLEQMDVFTYILELYGSFFSSLIGCTIVVFAVMSIALVAGRGKVSNASLIIAGQVFAAAIAVVIAWIRDYLLLYGDATALTVLSNAQTATFTGTYDVVSVAVFAVPLLACMAIIMLMSNRLTLLAFNEDEARTMGISTNRTRNFMVALCTIMTALVISFCGAVGFVGFMVPHIARKMVGPNFRYLLPACALLGAVMVCAIYYISVLGIPWIPEGSTGMITSVVGCVAFIVMAVKNRGAASGQWI